VKPVLDLVVTCTNRKRHAIPPELSLRNVKSKELHRRADAWINRLENSSVISHPAQELYAGDHWANVSALVAELQDRGSDPRLWICSAGYGLISETTPIKPYQATFATGKPDSVLPSMTRTDRKAWWSRLSHWDGPVSNMPRRLSDIPRKYGFAPMFVILSDEYFDAVIDDLESVLSDEYFADHLLILSCGSDRARSLFQRNTLPCDADMQHVVGGTRTALNIRLARYMLRRTPLSKLSFLNLRKIADSIERRRVSYDRKQVTDRQVERFIISEIRKEFEVSASKLLRRFRDRGFACEQSRFANIFRNSTGRIKGE
jgi:hypothetical protein